MDSYNFLKKQDFNYELEPVCALDPLLLIPRLEYIPAIFSLIQTQNLDHTIVILDLKNFHIINDIYNYDTGDKVIFKFISIARSYLPKNSIILRFRHGDEFLFFVPKNLSKTVKCFNSLKSHCENLNFLSDITEGNSSISFRFAALKCNNLKGYRELLEIAEKKLREVKKEGSPRN